jgi:glutathione S-transferase
MFFEQKQLEPSIANLRYWTTVRRQPEQRAAQLPLWRAQGKSALDVMEKHLDGADWFVSDRPSVADLALYGYTHVAGEGGIELGSYPRIRSWLERIRALPGHVDLG